MSFILRWKAGQHHPCHTPTYCRANFYSTCANGHHSLWSHNTLEYFRTWIVRKYRHSTFDTRCHKLWSHSTLDSSGITYIERKYGHSTFGYWCHMLWFHNTLAWFLAWIVQYRHSTFYMMDCKLFHHKNVFDCYLLPQFRLLRNRRKYYRGEKYYKSRELAVTSEC